MCPAVVVKNLGVWFDANFSFADDVHNICKTCFIQMCDLRRVRQYLTDNGNVLGSNAFVSKHLDYCNSLFSFPLSTCNCNKHGHLLFSNDSIDSIGSLFKITSVQKSFPTWHTLSGMSMVLDLAAVME